MTTGSWGLELAGADTLTTAIGWLGLPETKVVSLVKRKPLAPSGISLGSKDVVCLGSIWNLMVPNGTELIDRVNPRLVGVRLVRLRLVREKLALVG